MVKAENATEVDMLRKVAMAKERKKQHDVLLLLFKENSRGIKRPLKVCQESIPSYRWQKLKTGSKKKSVKHGIY